MRKKHARRPTFLPADTTPTVRRNMDASIGQNLFWLIAIPLAAYVAITFTGMPALRWQYTYYPAGLDLAERRYTDCVYLTFSGFQRISPAPGIDQCGLIRFFPFPL